MPEQLFLGVDGGQSSTTALISDRHGRILGRGIGGPCNHASAAEGRRKFVSAMNDCLEQACREAQLSPREVSFEGVCFGLSGGAEDKAAYVYEAVRSRHYKLTHDGEIALTGATGGAPGIIIIAGTGSFAFGKNADKKTRRSGGWGYIYGDEGGAFDLTRRALRAALRHEEGWGPATMLTDLLLSAAEKRTANELLHSFYADVPRAIVASYAPIVTSAAEEGDAVAIQILEQAADDLCRYVGGVFQQLFTSESELKVSYIGGVFLSSLLLSSFTAKVRAAVGQVPAPPLYDPAFGALLEALAFGEVESVSLQIDTGKAS